MLEPRGGLWSSGSVSDREWNNQRSVAVAVGGGSGGGEVMMVVR